MALLWLNNAVLLHPAGLQLAQETFPDLFLSGSEAEALGTVVGSLGMFLEEDEVKTSGIYEALTDLKALEMGGKPIPLSSLKLGGALRAIPYSRHFFASARAMMFTQVAIAPPDAFSNDRVKTLFQKLDERARLSLRQEEEDIEEVLKIPAEMVRAILSKSSEEQFASPKRKTKNVASLKKERVFQSATEIMGDNLSRLSGEKFAFHLISCESSKGFLSAFKKMRCDGFDPLSHHSKAEWGALFKQKNFLCFLATHEGEPIGFVFGYEHPQIGRHAYFLHQLVVDPRFSEKGVEAQLFKLLAIPAFLMGYPQVLRRENFDLVDLTEDLLVPYQNINKFLIGRAYPRGICYAQEARDPFWYRRFPPFPLSQIPQPIEVDDFIKLLRFIDWKDVGDLQLEKMHSHSTDFLSLFHSPLTVAPGEAPGRAFSEAIPFILQTEFFLELKKRFSGNLTMTAEEKVYKIFSHGEEIGTLFLPHQNRIFSIVYEGKLNPKGREEILVVQGGSPLHHFDIPLGDLYFLLNTFAWFEEMKARFSADGIKTIVSWLWDTIKGGQPLVTLQIIFYALSCLSPKGANCFVHALSEASRNEKGVPAFIKWASRFLEEKDGIQKLEFFSELLLQYSKSGFPVAHAISEWGVTLEKELRIDQETVSDTFFRLVGKALCVLILQGVGKETLDAIFTDISKLSHWHLGFMALRNVAAVFKERGLDGVQQFLKEIQKPLYLELDTKGGWDHPYDMWVLALGQVFAFGKADFADLIVEIVKKDERLGAYITAIVSRGEEGFRFAQGLQTEIAGRKDKRLREKLMQCLVAAYQKIDKADKQYLPALIKAAKEDFPDDSYKMCDRILDYLHLAETAEEIERVQSELRNDPNISRLQQSFLDRLGTHYGFAATLNRWPRYTARGFIGSARDLMDTLNSGNPQDPNIRHLMQQAARHGDIHGYYRNSPEAQRTIAILKREGYDIEHLVFGNEPLLKAVADPKKKENGNPTIKRLKELLPNIEPSAGAVRSYLEDPQNILDPQTRQELRDLSGDLEWQTAHGSHGKGGDTIESRISRKAIPELFFDNRRLACCIFLPHGELQSEIPLMAMDPQTPLVDFWISGHDELMGTAPLYAGKDLNIFLDTFEFGSALTTVLGVNPTYHFVLDSLVEFARRSAAKRLLVFKARYGHPLAFANYVADMAKRESFKEAIIFDPAFEFQMADPNYHALQASRNRHRLHYTDAYRTPDFKRGPVTGKIPVYVIDVEKYLAI